MNTIQSPSHIVNTEIESIKLCINDITKQLKIIEQRLNYNKSIWLLSSVRSYGLENHIKELKILMNVLNYRFNMLLLYKTNTQQENCSTINESSSLEDEQSSKKNIMPHMELFDYDNDILP